MQARLHSQRNFVAEWGILCPECPDNGERIVVERFLAD